MRVVVPQKLAMERRAKAVPLEALRARQMFVDGYNVLISAESLLSGRAVYLCDDGILRDAEGIFRGYKATARTEPALAEILDILAQAAPSGVEVLLDQQMSMSGQLAGLMREMMAARGLPGTAATVRDVDHQLKATLGVVATGDGNVIDAVAQVFDLPGEIARRRGISLAVL